MQSLDTLKQQRRAVSPSSLKNLRPFKPGDARINRKGRPRGFDELRALAQRISHETISVDGATMSRAESILRSWASSKDPQAQRWFIEFGYGKPPDKIETNLAPKTVLRLYYAHERPDLVQQTSTAISAANAEETRRLLISHAD